MEGKDVFKVNKYSVLIEGLADIMFDRFIDYSTSPRPWKDKLYLYGNNELVMPSENIEAMLWGEDPQGCAKAFEGKRGKEYIRMGAGHVIIKPFRIPILQNGEPIKFTEEKDPRFSVVEASGRTKQGSRSIKQEIKQRPILRLPWEIKFEVSIVENSLIDGAKIFNWLERAGLLIGLGTWRPKYGRFFVYEFKEIKEERKGKKQ